MQIAIIASDKRKELMTEFCVAYCGILSRHHLCATGTTGKYLSEATGLNIETLVSGIHGGTQMIANRIAYNEIDLLLYFRDTNDDKEYADVQLNLVRMCDKQNIPVATNIATAEVLICALDHGDLDWREIVNPRSDYNRRRRGMNI